MSALAVDVASPADLPDLVRFFRAVGAEEHPGDPSAPDRTEAGLHRSLAVFDFLRSSSCWLLLARKGGQAVGYCVAVRIPKADARAGFLFVDELYVLKPYRRQGVARALIAQVQSLAQSMALAGVRLLVRPQNGAARALYRDCSFEEQESLFCQWRPQADFEG